MAIKDSLARADRALELVGRMRSVEQDVGAALREALARPSPQATQALGLARARLRTLSEEARALAGARQ